MSLPLQWFLNGSTSPGISLPELAIELQHYGISDLRVSGAVVPGAFRPVEKLLALSVAGNQPDPRILEGIPAVLAWTYWHPTLLQPYAQGHDPRAWSRLGWLADIVLTIHRDTGFPGGCSRLQDLETLVRQPRPLTDDDLGRPADGTVNHPVWKRWNISYAASLASFQERAERLYSLQLQGGRDRHE